MSIIAEKVFEAVKTLPEQQAAEFLDFVEFLKSKTEKGRGGRREIALATLDKHMVLYDGTLSLGKRCMSALEFAYADFILKSAGTKAADVVELKSTALDVYNGAK